MVSLRGFDADKVEPMGDMELMPSGDYEVAIVASKSKESRSGSMYLELELQVLDGRFKGRKLWDRLNLWHDNETAKTMAKATLSSICRAVGVRTPGDSAELHGRPMLAKVVVRNDAQYGDRNEVKGYRAAKTSAAGPGGLPVDDVPF